MSSTRVGKTEVVSSTVANHRRGAPGKPAKDQCCAIDTANGPIIPSPTDHDPFVMPSPIPCRYTDENKAREHFEKLLWPEGPTCPRCGSVDRSTELKGKSTRPGVYKCKDCRKPFFVTVGTLMERSHIKINVWLAAMHLMTASKKGMSAHQMGRMLGLSYESAWFLCHRLREAMRVPLTA
jgi:transposase-like protein